MYPTFTPSGYATGYTTAIAVHTRYLPLAFLLAFFAPRVDVDGQPAPAAWGRSVIPVQPGLHHVHVHVPYLLPRRIGEADLMVGVAPGQTLELEYRAPAIAFMRGSLGAPPQPYRGLPALIAMVSASLVLAVAAGTGTVLMLRPSRTPVVASSPTAPSTTTSAPEPSGATTSPSASSASGDRTKPTLKDVPARSLVGPTFTATDKTYTMAMAGWPFAFRTPGTWGCMGTKPNVSDGVAVICKDEGDVFGSSPAPAAKPDQLAKVTVRTCPASCTATERRRLEREWFDVLTSEEPRRVDERTTYLEGEDTRGLYTLTMSHFFAADGGSTIDTQVGIIVKSKAADRADVQPIANDVLSQAP